MSLSARAGRISQSPTMKVAASTTTHRRYRTNACPSRAKRMDPPDPPGDDAAMRAALDGRLTQAGMEMAEPATR